MVILQHHIANEIGAAKRTARLSPFVHVVSGGCRAIGTSAVMLSFGCWCRLSSKKGAAMFSDCMVLRRSQGGVRAALAASGIRLGSCWSTRYTGSYVAFTISRRSILFWVRSTQVASWV